MVQPVGIGSGDLVCECSRGRASIHSGRLLVCLYKYPGFSVLVIALVFPNFYLGSVSVASFSHGVAFSADSS